MKQDSNSFYFLNRLAAKEGGERRGSKNQIEKIRSEKGSIL